MSESLGGGIGGLFGGGGGDITSTVSPGAETGGITLGLPPGGSVETGAGGVAPGSVIGIPGGDSSGGGFDIGSILKMAAGGMTGLNALKGLFSRSPTEGDVARMGKLSSRAGKTAGGLLNAYNAGKLTPTQQAAADQFEKQELAKWRQYLADAGIPESSAMVDIENKVHQDKLVFMNNQLQQNFKNAMEATGMAQGSLATQAQQNWMIDQASQKAMADAMAAIGGIFGSGRDTVPPMTTTGGGIWEYPTPFAENYSDTIPSGVEFT